MNLTEKYPRIKPEAEEALYESLCNNGETLKTYTGDANKLFNDILNAYKDILVGNIYCLEMGKYLHVTDVFGKWLVASDGDAGIYLKCKRLTYQAFGSSTFPCCENTEMSDEIAEAEVSRIVEQNGPPKPDFSANYIDDPIPSCFQGADK